MNTPTKLCHITASWSPTFGEARPVYCCARSLWFYLPKIVRLQVWLSSF